MTLEPTFHCRVLSAGADHAFDVRPDQTLLDAAQQRGMTLRASCRNGTCRTCRCLLVAGTVLYRVPWPGLSMDEREEGWLLPCVAMPQSDVVMQMLDVP